MKNTIIGISIFIVLWFILGFIGIDIPYALPYFIEWATKFILPWLFLFWLIRLTRSLEKK
jgi:hypothetical protein